MKAIALNAVQEIARYYKIPKDIQAEKAIEDATFDTMQWTGWHRPEHLMPDFESTYDCVLAIVSGHNKEGDTYKHTYCFACWNPQTGWWLDDPVKFDDFTVEYWSYLPDPPASIRKEVAEWISENTSEQSEN